MRQRIFSTSRFLVRVLSALFAMVCIVANSIFSTPPTFAAPITQAATAEQGTTWYVAPNGANGDGSSAARAWNELDRIHWNGIKPGDTVRVLRGTYQTTMNVGANGTPDRPIRILFDPGTVLFGGRSEPLPNCGQQSYTGRAAKEQGIKIDNRSYIVVDGQQWNGVKIHGWQRGIDIVGGSHDIIIRNGEITDNGIPQQTGSGWRPGTKAVMLGHVFRLRFERLNLYDNGSDSFQANGNIRDITFTNVWMHNDRGILFNGCIHPDGLQITGPYHASNISFERVVSGPNVYHTVLTGSSGENFRFTDVLVFEPITSTFACRKACTNWQFNRITSDGKDGRMNFEMSGTGHSISNSLVTKGKNKLPHSVQFANNYQYQLTGAPVGTQLNPNYRNPSNGDFTPQANVNGAGSCLHSVNDLLRLNGAQLLSNAELESTPEATDEEVVDEAVVNEEAATNDLDEDAPTVFDIPSTNDLGPMTNVSTAAVEESSTCGARSGTSMAAATTTIHVPLVWR